MWFFGVLLIVATAQATLYDSFTGKPATRAQIRRYCKAGTTEYCLTNIHPKCDPNDYRRVAGSCNNLRHPQRGASHTPSYRVLPRVFSTGYRNRKTQDNQELKPPRYVRTQALYTGKGSSTKFTQLSLYFLLFMVNDIGTLEDILHYILRRTYCCLPKSKLDDMCSPMLIPYNDPVHRFSNVRCMNMTRPYTFQYYKCLDNNTTPERIMPSTPLFDLSQIYHFIPGAILKLREYSGGRLLTNVVNGYAYPPSGNKENYIPCVANKKPRETQCHLYHSNGVLGPNLVSIWVYRIHNYFASILEKLNPCWNDEKLFYTARDITIAFVLQIFFYELLPLLLGKKNMIRDGVISCNKGFRDIYDENILPQMSDEFEYMLRYFHISQENSVHLYDNEGYFMRSVPMVNLTARTGFVVLHEAQISRGSYRQFTGATFDSAVDPGLADLGFAGVQTAFDITAADVTKGRLFGFAPYKDYREFCTKKKYTKWDDFYDTISEERLYRLRIIYKYIEDLELMPATWNEMRMKDAEVPPTLYCLMVEQLIRSIKSDRHWYERKNRPHAFTYEQLMQIRNANMAYLMCLVAPEIDIIQPSPFLKCGPKNRYVTCNKIKKMDLSPWKEC